MRNHFVIIGYGVWLYCLQLRKCILWTVFASSTLLFSRGCDRGWNTSDYLLLHSRMYQWDKFLLYRFAAGDTGLPIPSILHSLPILLWDNNHQWATYVLAGGYIVLEIMLFVALRWLSILFFTKIKYYFCKSFFSVYHFPKSSAYVSEKMYKLCHLFVQIILSFVQTSKKFVQSSSKNSACFS